MGEILMTIEKSKVLYLYIRTDKRRLFLLHFQKIWRIQRRGKGISGLSAFNTWDRLCPKG
jgi:hypothetical protein